MKIVTYQLDQVCEKITDGTHHSPPVSDSGIPYVTAKHIKEDGVRFFDDPWFVSEQDHAAIYSRCDPRKGDVLYIKDGATTGIAAVNEFDFPFSMLSSVALLRPRLDLCDPRFLVKWLNSPMVKEWNLRQMGGAAIKRLTLAKIKKFQIPLPPLAEQKRIAGILDAADALRAKRRAALAQLDALAQSLFLDLFGDPVTNPKGWEVLTGDAICRRITVGIVVHPASYYRESGVPALRSLNVRANRISLDNLVYFSKSDNEGKLAKTRVRENDILLVRSGQPGTAAVVPKHLDGINAIDILIATPDLSLVNPTYLSFYFNSPGGKAMALGAQRGQIQKHLNVGSLKVAPIPVPPLPLQQRFAAAVEAIERQKARHREQLAGLDALFASLQHRAFRGEL